MDPKEFPLLLYKLPVTRVMTISPSKDSPNNFSRIKELVMRYVRWIYSEIMN